LFGNFFSAFHQNIYQDKNFDFIIAGSSKK